MLERAKTEMRAILTKPDITGQDGREQEYQGIKQCPLDNWVGCGICPQKKKAVKAALQKKKRVKTKGRF